MNGVYTEIWFYYITRTCDCICHIMQWGQWSQKNVNRYIQIKCIKRMSYIVITPDQLFVFFLRRVNDLM